MASTTVSLNLKLTDNWVIEDSVNEEIAPAYQQKVRPPKVGWISNILSTPEGLKSSTNHLDTTTFGLKNGAFTRTDSRLTKLVDTLGFVTYATTARFISNPQHFELSIFWKEGQLFNTIATDLSSTETSMHTHMTLFQNRTLVAFDDNTTLNGTLAGDDVTRGLFEVTVAVAGITLTRFALTGITMNTQNFRGITSFGNYVLLWNETTLFWSDPILFTEFTVGGSSLAGSQKVSEARGNLITIVPYPTGLIIYCAENIVSVQYSGDPTNPWIFTEIFNGASIGFAGTTPMVTRQEDSAIQYAYTSKGLLRVTANEATPLSTKLDNFLGNNYIELRAAVASNEIVHKYLSEDLNYPSKVRWIELVDNFLCICLGAEIADGVTLSQEFIDSHMIIINLTSGAMSSVQFQVAAVVSAMELPVIQTTAAAYIKSRRTNNLLLCAYRRNRQSSETFLVDLSNKSDNVEHSPHQEDIPGVDTIPNFIVGDISIKPNRLTEVLRVKLTGETMRRDAEGISIEDTRVKIFAYSSINGSTNPVEFIYYPSVDSYLGFIVGSDVEIEVRGTNFYLTDFEVEIQDGGRA